MAKKDIFLLVDTETTIKDHVVDFGGIVCTRKGEILHSCGILVSDFYEKEELFYRKSEKSGIWSWEGKDKRIVNYQNMITGGMRIVASVGAINRWLERVKAEYGDNVIVTAYNLAFDKGKCQNSGIDLGMFSQSFCLWYAAADKWGNTKDYKNFVLQMHEFTNRTELGNMSYRTNAELMVRFVLNNPEMEDEPHTALEDARDYELPILTALVKNTPKKKWMDPAGYNWRNYQLKDHFRAI